MRHAACIGLGQTRTHFNLAAAVDLLERDGRGNIDVPAPDGRWPACVLTPPCTSECGKQIGKVSLFKPGPICIEVVLPSGRWRNIGALPSAS